jgi:hypothetical protein
MLRTVKCQFFYTLCLLILSGSDAAGADSNAYPLVILTTLHVST